MRRLTLLLSIFLAVAGCDSGDPEAEPFSLTVSAQSSSGETVSGLSVLLRYPYAGTAKTSESAKGGGVFVSVAPNPFRVSARARVDLPQETNLRMELLRVDSTLALTVHEGTLGMGSYAFTLDGSQLPGGAYRLRTTGGGAEVDRWLLKTDDLSLDVSEGISRSLGTLFGDEPVRTTDRTVALPLYDVPAIAWTDEQGTLLGELRLSGRVQVVVTNGAREVSADVVLVDGRNEVTIDW